MSAAGNRVDAGRPFLKMHGLRNHFVIVDAREMPFRPGVEEVVRICDPEIGVGGDQLIVIEPSARAGAFMRIYNVDGREVEACGNAARCIAWLLLEEHGADEVNVETLAGLLRCWRSGERMVRCDMGPIRLAWDDALHVDLAAGSLEDPVAVDIGNPHAVFFVPDLAAVDVAAIAPGIQRDARFPQGVNVGVAEVLDGRRVRIVVYERGVGLTTACGSGACAAAFAARARGLIESRIVTVVMPAGEVGIELLEDGHAVMTGPVAYCFRGTLPC